MRGGGTGGGELEEEEVKDCSNTGTAAKMQFFKLYNTENHVKLEIC